jgi:OPT family oligopeptide transporter
MKQLTDEEIRDWSLEKKDRWWFENVFRHDMPQLTIRSGLTGMMLGGVLSLTNLYVGAKTGWTLGVGITSVILAFAFFKVLSQFKLSTEMSLLENNAMQSIATAAGYMTAPLVTSVGAYMMVVDRVLPMWTVMVWIAAINILGALFAFPLKKRFINDEQLPFPEGRAAGVVMEALHTGDASVGLFKAKILVVTAGLSSLIAVMKSEAIMKKLKVAFLTVPEYLDGWMYKLGTPAIMGTPLKNMTVRLDSDIVMIAAGGLMGVRTGASLMVGAFLNYFIFVPWMIKRGDIVGKLVEGQTMYTLKAITFWSLWGGVATMTAASLLAFFAKPQVFISAIKGLMRRGEKKEDLLKDIELPMSVFFIGIPIVGGVVVVLAKMFFGVSIWLGMIAVPLVFVFTLVAVNSTGLTSITPTGALGKLTQLTYAVLAPGNVTTNLMAAGITGEVAGSASNLLMDIKPGYMLGGKPRHQAVGHVLGIIAGAVCSVPIFYLVFLHKGPQQLITDQYPMPGITIWKGVAEALTKGLHTLAPSAQIGALVGVCVGLILEGLKIGTKGRFWLSPVGVGLAFILPFNNSLAMSLGSFFFWFMERRVKNEKALSHRVFVQNLEPTCAGIIAGGAITGILVVILETFVLAE